MRLHIQHLSLLFNVCFACGLFMIAGCGPQSELGTEGDSKALRQVGQLYGHFLARNGRPPANQEEFEEFLIASGSKNIEQRMISPRDREPLIVLYGDQIGPLSPEGMPWVAHEKIGVAGNRYAISARGTVQEMSPDEFEQTFSVNISQEATSSKK